MSIIPNDFSLIFPYIGNDFLSHKFGVSRSTIQRWAKRHNLEKDKDYKSKIQADRTKNRVFSKETIDIFRVKATGRRHSLASRQKAVATKILNGTLLKGDRHSNWKGGKPWERFKDRRYLAWRNSVLQRDRFTCQHCLRVCGKNEKGLAAHHIKPYATHPDLRFDLENGQTLCRECHMTVHGRPICHVMISCECGCGTIITGKDKYGRPRSYVNGHARRKRGYRNEGKV